MKKLRQLSIPALSLYLIFCLLISAKAQNTPKRETKDFGNIDPYEVIFYRNINYINPIGKWKLKPGMRLLKIPHLNTVPDSKFSLIIGSKVGVFLFPEADFISTKIKVSSKVVNPFLPFISAPDKAYLRFYKRVKTSIPEISFYNSSLIIYRKDIKDIIGVAVQSKKWGKFFSLPEFAKNKKSVYKTKGDNIQGQDIKVSLEISGDGSWSNLGLPHVNPRPENIKVAIQSENGNTLQLPGPNSPVIDFNLKDYGFSGKVASLELRYKGPYSEFSYLPPKKHRAPPTPSPHVVLAKDKEDARHQSTKHPARTIEHGNSGREISKVGTGRISATTGQPTKPQGITPKSVPNVSGQWKSNIGVIYDMTQNGDNFEWTVKSKNENGKGFIKGNDISASWKSPFGSGASNGKITAVDSAGQATKIQWNNGVVFFK
jgi:hypothetical protein